MMRFTACHLKATLPCRAHLISKRRSLFFTERIKIDKHVQRSLVQSTCQLSRKSAEFVKGSVDSKCVNLVETAKDAEEIEKKGNQPAKQSKTRAVKKDKNKTMKYLHDESPIKENNLDLFREMSGDDENMFNELRYLQMKVDMMSKIYGVKPEMTREKWLEFLHASKNMRTNYLSYLISIALRNETKVKPKYDLPTVEHTSDNSAFDDPMCYHLFHNSMFLKFRVPSIRKRLYSKLMASMLYSPEIFIDCSYDKYMSPMESKYLGKQIIDCMRQNFHSEQPYKIVLCNFDRESNLAKSITKHSNLFFESYYPITLTEKSYTDLYPREKLVYLTPHCDSQLKEIVPDKRYIIGGYVDKAKSQQISLAKAKENRITMAKFPLDRYLDWQKGKKSLCVNHVFSVMLSLKNNNNDWLKALEIIPKRCITRNTRNKLTKKSNIYENAKLVFSLRDATVDDIDIPDIELEEHN